MVVKFYSNWGIILGNSHFGTTQLAQLTAGISGAEPPASAATTSVWNGFPMRLVQFCIHLWPWLTVKTILLTKIMNSWTLQFSPFMETQCPPSCSKMSFIGPYSEQDAWTSKSTHPISWTCILLLSFHLYLGHPTGPFLWCLSVKTLSAVLISFMCATCSTHLIYPCLIASRALGYGCK